MKIVINGIHANLRFSAAHLIPKHESCGVIHGHSYIVDVVVEGERSGEFGFVVDFKKVKSIVRDICKKLDHRVLIPIKNPEMDFKNLEDSVEFSIGKKEYKLPVEDCVLLDLGSTSAEDLSQYFAEELYQQLKELGEISSVQICVNEGIGQGAYFTKNAE
ncbi:6-carboxytetrahydropterin synthase QueD [Methanobacterium paludis]|uniref:6-pyruvoyltetrahydropterin synthase n=1 Tax=Methanobacterium paludis (strain DSM 25820 / JCM 18151 / SWAN1) TaxID=868131 RepID=F6D3G9_METPW|nr:6-carboxytetrahydropterin synthase QueD [Methanobacterium paludis]AEG19145.1 6-pyruvoyltetrahydropterin synthase [Methanobacterium paludis]